MSKVCIAITTCDSLNLLPSWIEYHVNLVDQIFLFVDQDNINLPNHPKLRVITGSQKSTHAGPSGVMERQVENINQAIILAKQAKMDWLIQIDDDELIYTTESLNLVLDSIDPGFSKIILFNHEILHTNNNVKNCFLECKTFKTNPNLLVKPPSWARPTYFLFYSQGKIAVNLDAFKHCDSVHDFDVSYGSIYKYAPITILHYPCASYETWFKKYQKLDTWSNFWYDDPKLPIKLPFHVQSRDIVNQNNPKVSKEFFDSILATPEEEKQLIRNNICFQVD